MFTRTIGRVGAAAALALALLVASAMPAAASATYVEIGASSSIVLRNPSNTGPVIANVHIKGHATDNICAPNSEQPTHIPITNDSTGTGTIGPSTTGYGDFVLGTSTFKSRLVIVSGSYVSSTTGITITMSIRAEIRTCDSLALLCTTNPVGITLTGPSTGTHHPTVSMSETVTGISNHITVPPVGCNALLRAAFTNATATASLNLHFTDSTV